MKISDIANENTEMLPAGSAMTTTAIIRALETFPEDTPMYIVFTDKGRIIGAVTHIDGVMGNNYEAGASNFAGVLVDLETPPMSLADVAQGKSPSPIVPDAAPVATPTAPENPLAS